MGDTLTPLLQAAIALAKQSQAQEVEPDHVLVASLLSISRFGIARIGPLDVDLEQLGVDWKASPTSKQPKSIAYSAVTVTLLDTAASIARADQSQLRLAHLLAAFTAIPPTDIWQKLGIQSAAWRTALVSFDVLPPKPPATADSYLSPEQAADLLGVHHQTIRTYIRTGKLAAVRIAGERAVRIRRESLDQLMEPLTSFESE